MTIPIETAEEVKQLLLRGFPQRYVARAMGLARGTVLKIAKGKWQPSLKECGFSRRCQARDQPEALLLPARGRCPECGVKLTRFPCRACSARSALAKRPLRPGLLLELIGKPLGLNLHGNEERRYLRIRRWKEEHPDCKFIPHERLKAWLKGPIMKGPVEPKWQGIEVKRLAPGLRRWLCAASLIDRSEDEKHETEAKRSAQPLPDPGYELFAALRKCIIKALCLSICGQFRIRFAVWLRAEKRRQVRWCDQPLPVPQIPAQAPFGALTEQDFRELLGYTGELSDAELDGLTVQCGIDLAEVS